MGEVPLADELPLDMFSFGGSASFTIVTPATKNYADGAGVKFTFERDG